MADKTIEKGTVRVPEWADFGILTKEELDQLARPFPSRVVKWRPSMIYEARDNKGFEVMLLAYIDARDVMDRLDEVFGVYGWQDKYEKWGEKAVKCSLAVYDRSSGQWIVKEDVSDETDFEATKGGVSGALRRAAVKYGIGRYLYGLGDSRERIVSGSFWGNDDYIYINDRKTGAKGYVKKPTLPDWALPEEERGQQEPVKRKTEKRQSQSPKQESKPEPKQETESAQLADENQKKAIQSIATIVQMKGKSIDINAIIKKQFNKNSVDDLTYDEAAQLIPELNKFLA